MPHYVVNKQPQPNSGDHEVHRTDTCTRLPLLHNQEALGWHPGCASGSCSRQGEGVPHRQWLLLLLE
jgi:hypothetical protein